MKRWDEKSVEERREDEGERRLGRDERLKAKPMSSFHFAKVTRECGMESHSDVDGQEDVANDQRVDNQDRIADWSAPSEVNGFIASHSPPTARLHHSGA